MGINEIIMYIMMFFMLIAAVDRILSQFGGSARFLGKFGKSIEGSGGQFEEGFMAMGALGLAMVGMTALAPVLAHVLGPVIILVYEMLGANPSMFAGTLLACDMGGFFLAKELAGGDVAAWLYSGLILGSMMGPTIVFSIPVALGIIEPSDRRYLALGVLALQPLQPVLQSPALQPAFANVVPALFGAMAYQYYRKNIVVAIAPLVVMSVLFTLVPGLISSTSFMIIPSGALAIGIAYTIYKKKKQEAQA